MQDFFHQQYVDGFDEFSEVFGDSTAFTRSHFRAKARDAQRGPGGSEETDDQMVPRISKTPGLRSYPIGSMCGIFTYSWLISMVNVGKYTIHGWYGY